MHAFNVEFKKLPFEKYFAFKTCANKESRFEIRRHPYSTSRATLKLAIFRKPRPSLSLESQSLFHEHQ